MLVSFLLIIVSLGCFYLYRITALLYVGAFLNGIAAANHGIALPLAVESFSSGDEYVYYMSRVTMGTMLATAFTTYIGNAIYDICGTYSIEFIIYAVLQILCIILMCILLKDRDFRK